MNILYHVITNQNLEDLSTKPDKVNLDDVGPLLAWQKDMSQAIEEMVPPPFEDAFYRR